MRKTTLTSLAIVIVSTVSACGGDGGTTRVVPVDRLEEALLSLDDFGEGWGQELRDVFTSRAEGPQSFDPSGWCPKAQAEIDDLATVEDLAGDTGAAAEFRLERRDPRRQFHGVSQQMWSNENVSSYFDLVSQGFNLCNGVTWSPEAGQDITVTSLASPKLGDESLALNVSIVTPGPDGEYVWASRMVIVVVDSSLMILRDLDVQLAGGEPFLTDAEWNDLVGVAMGRFTDVVGTTSAKGGFLATDPFFSEVTPPVPVR